MNINRRPKAAKSYINPRHSRTLLVTLAIAIVATVGSYYVSRSSAADYYIYLSFRGLNSSAPAAAGNNYTASFNMAGGTVSNTNHNNNTGPYDPADPPSHIQWTASVMATNGGAIYEGIGNISPSSGQLTIGGSSVASQDFTVSFTTTNNCGGTLQINATMYSTSGRVIGWSNAEATPTYGSGCPVPPVSTPTPPPAQAPGNPNPPSNGGPPTRAPGRESGDTTGGGPSGSQGDSPEQTQSNSGGANSGASANQQNDRPNNIPTTAEQGEDKNQPEVEPSPFFDGKQYERGSDRVIATTQAGTLKTVKKYWMAIGSALFIGASGTAGYLWWRKTRN